MAKPQQKIPPEPGLFFAVVEDFAKFSFSLILLGAGSIVVLVAALFVASYAVVMRMPVKETVVEFFEKAVVFFLQIKKLWG